MKRNGRIFQTYSRLILVILLDMTLATAIFTNAGAQMRTFGTTKVGHIVNCNQITWECYDGLSDSNINGIICNKLGRKHDLVILGLVTMDDYIGICDQLLEPPCWGGGWMEE